MVAAQDGLPAHTWSRGTTLSASVGAASAPSANGALAGVGIGWEVTPRFGIEGEAAWLDRPGDSEAFAAALTAQFRLRGLQPVSPYVKGGVGMYRLSLDVPRATFTDPSAVVGGGVRLFATRHLAFRPEVQAMVVARDAGRQVVTAIAVHVEYHFEDHVITPADRLR
jgi:hypothetical protein